MPPTLNPSDRSRDWTGRDEAASLRLAAVTTWAVGLFVDVLDLAPGWLALLVTVPIAVACWHLSDTVDRRRDRAAIRFSQSVRSVEARDHLRETRRSWAIGRDR